MLVFMDQTCWLHVIIETDHGSLGAVFLFGIGVAQCNKLAYWKIENTYPATIIHLNYRYALLLHSRKSLGCELYILTNIYQPPACLNHMYETNLL